MKKTLLAASVAALMCGSAQADTLLGLYVGGQIWSNEASGSFGEGRNNQTAFEFDDENQGSFYAALEHPIPLIPNIKIASTTLDTIGGTTLPAGSSFTFKGQSYGAGSTLATTLDASFVDYTFYYEVFDNDLLTFDFGLTARDLEAYVKVSDANNSSDLDVSGIIPMAYVSTIVGLPFTGFNIFAEANFISYDSQTVYDAQIGVSYAILDNLAVDFDVTLGYRTVKMELDDLDNFYSDLTYDGFFVGAVVHF
ncbi:TIGR04219 family outer membrane beta-barrel protein [Colwellia ponticola]|uniref:TIGR04219 family outer membrane beta-barrel protein n=1 Tax=Colwellia ponticola TaxID=2304625 RepID=A0A8H2JPP7_9GAMM|nr:TIGR04219 family outer membrane beta-barrel protein [Colwellia ponticola]TMM47946.1 TIGR04219 family outer membrane beta-barrel protein [Colwellia ponticola]